MSMKALCLAVSCTSIGLGDLIVIIIAESNFFQNRVSNIFYYKFIHNNNNVLITFFFLHIIIRTSRQLNFSSLLVLCFWSPSSMPSCPISTSMLTSAMEMTSRPAKTPPTAASHMTRAVLSLLAIAECLLLQSYTKCNHNAKTNNNMMMDIKDSIRLNIA